MQFVAYVKFPLNIVFRAGWELPFIKTARTAVSLWTTEETVFRMKVRICILQVILEVGTTWEWGYWVTTRW